MYFDSTKKSYYRFPSRNSFSDFERENAFYFPDKPKLVPEDLYINQDSYSAILKSDHSSENRFDL